ncbi:DUF4352 domain-containing protein [Rhodococcus ruber]|uniref:DUF4352 domain-containing protein n=1 Tax=Rhodococcus ruber TaxID=1830 RepID=UPI0009E40845|nr:DUF4352 domain-containing protein [Rhodococcus ruber]
MNPPAGWYSDPQNPHMERWWDGTQWGPQSRPRGVLAPPPPPPPSRPSKKSYIPLWIVLGLAGLGILVTLIQNAGDDESSSSSRTTTRTAAAPRTTTAAPAPLQATPPASAPSPTAAATARTPAAPAGIGRPYRDGKFEFVVNSWDGTTAHITVRNIGDEPQFMNTSAQYLYDTQGRKFEPEGNLGSELFLATLNPGQSASGTFTYVLSGAVPSHLELHDSMFSGGVEVPLR